MKDILFKSLKKYFIFLTSVLLGWFLDVINLFNYFFNFKFSSIVYKNSPFSYIIIFLLLIIAFLIVLVYYMKKEINSFKKAHADIGRLNKFFDIFSVDAMRIFIDQLELNMIYLEQMDHFQEGINRFRFPGNCFQYQPFEEAKEEFFEALEELFKFTHENEFNTINDGVRIKLYGGYHEIELAKKHTQFKKDEKEFRELSIKVMKKWNKLIELISSKYPNYDFEKKENVA